VASISAAAFDRSARTAEDLKTFWREDPVGAASWVKTVAEAAGVEAAGLNEVKAALALGTDAMADALRPLADQFPALLQVAAPPPAQTQDARAATMGWTALATPPAVREAPSFTGRLVLENNTPRLVTTRGTFDLSTAGTNWRDEVETAFLGQLITVKGFPAAVGNTLHVEQFAPGADAHFINGRIAIEGTTVYVQPGGSANAATRVEITHPDFKALLLGDATRSLAAYSPAGVILPGSVETDAQGKRTYSQNPEHFYILGRIFDAQEVPVDASKKIVHGETGYFKHTSMVVPTSLVVPESTKPGAPHPIEGDTTVGSTKPGEGHRSFFYVKLLPIAQDVPAATPWTSERKMEVTWCGQAADQGTHAPASGPPAQDLATLAQKVPAGAPEHTAEEATLEPEDAAKFS